MGGLEKIASTSRREFLQGGMAVAGAALAPSLLPAARAQASQSVRVTIRTDQKLGSIAPNFMGLGYETSAVGQTGLLSTANKPLVRFVRRLGDRGVIRIGGKTSDYARWSPEGKAVSAPQTTIINRQAIRDLASFLEAVQWKLIWSLNLRNGTREEAVDQASFIAQTVGARLLAFETGDEATLFALAYCGDASVQHSRDESAGYAKDIKATVPSASFARASANLMRPLKYYGGAEGPRANSRLTIEKLLAGDPDLDQTLGELQSVSRDAGLPYRIVETGSCCGGDRSGASDTFASALWALDYMFTLAASGSSGVNIETGLNHLGSMNSRTPIDTSAQGSFIAKPIYYGMLAFSLVGHGDRIGLDSEARGVNFKAYATRSITGRLFATLINKDLTTSVDVHLTGATATEAKCIRLTAPSVQSTTGTKLGGSVVGPRAEWRSLQTERLKANGGAFFIHVAAGSAALVEL